MKFFESLANFDYSVEKTLADYANISIDEAKTMTKNMMLSDYMALVTALDVENEEEITRIIDKYLEVEEPEMIESFSYFENKDVSITELDILEERFFDFLNNASIKQISESNIFSKFDITEDNLYINYVPKEILEAYIKTQYMSYDEIFESVKPFINENTTYSQARDIFIMTFVKENLDHKTKQEIAKVTKAPVNNIKSPTYTDPTTKKSSTIISADSQQQAIVTQDEKGEVNIVDVRNPNNKKQIAVEEIDRIKQLAGLK